LCVTLASSSVAVKVLVTVIVVVVVLVAVALIIAMVCRYKSKDRGPSSESVFCYKWLLLMSLLLIALVVINKKWFKYQFTSKLFWLQAHFCQNI